LVLWALAGTKGWQKNYMDQKKLIAKKNRKTKKEVSKQNKKKKIGVGLDPGFTNEKNIQRFEIPVR
jgi:hypothetical protein